MEDLELIIKKNYDSNVLSSEQIKSITTQPRQSSKKTKSIYQRWVYAAAFILLLGCSYLLFLKQQPEQIINDFASEVAYNHKKGSSSDIETNNIHELDKKLTRLDFQLVLPERITHSFKLLGGKHCSVDNRVAAQLKFESADSQIITCYVFKKTEAFHFDKEIIKDDVKVAIWDSEELIYALASDHKKKKTWKRN